MHYYKSNVLSNQSCVSNVLKMHDTTFEVLKIALPLVGFQIAFPTIFKTLENVTRKFNNHKSQSYDTKRRRQMNTDKLTKHI